MLLASGVTVYKIQLNTAKSAKGVEYESEHERSLAHIHSLLAPCVSHVSNSSCCSMTRHIL